MKNFDFAIVGGGIVGAATAYKLSLKHPEARICLVEKEPTLAAHQTGRNSGVIHSGIYYKPGSLKAKNCFVGREQLVAFAEENHVPHDVCGKLIVATAEDEVARLQGIFERGNANGLAGLKTLDEKEMQSVEPFVRGLQALFVPQTGIIDFKDAVEKMKQHFLRQPKNEVQNGFEVVRIKTENNQTTLFSKSAQISAQRVIFCAGLQADRLAKLDGLHLDVATVPFRGDYYDLTDIGKHKVKNLIYPVPDPAFPFLGVHFTRMTDGTTECGPNAVFAFEREGYQRHSFSIKDTTEAFAFGGTWKMFAQHWQMGLHEQQRAWSKPLFLKALQKLIPDLKSEDIVRSRSGVRAMTLRKSGEMVDDFEFAQHGNNLHVLNAPSPAATACLAIADTIVDKLNGKGYKSDRL